ncbi:Cupredoxin [Cytidiella melzeri]|nr:Cupredoxin [Cytidiella melzeri]
MMFKVAALLSVASVALASPQIYGPAPGPATPATTSAAAASSPSAANSNQQIIQVGPNGGINFSPSDITAAVGTEVIFAFGASIPHSVTQSTFDAPCTPASGGFSSGLTNAGMSFSINITDASTPIYFFCEFPAHCGLGMVGTINAPTSGNTSTAFASAAMAIGSNEAAVANTVFVSGGLGALATAAPTAGTPSAAASSPSTSTTPSSASTMTVSTVAVLLGAVAAVFGGLL